MTVIKNLEPFATLKMLLTNELYLIFFFTTKRSYIPRTTANNLFRSSRKKNLLVISPTGEHYFSTVNFV
jgi:hypothetical protein